MIPCPKIPIFTYGVLKTPHKVLVLAGKIEGSMRGKLKSYKINDEGLLVRTDDDNNEVVGEILWINLDQYDELIQALDSYGEPSHKTQKEYHRTLCDVMTDEPPYRGIPPTSIQCWAYQVK